MRRRLSLSLSGVVLAAAAAAAQTGGTEGFLNQLDLNFSQYGERMGLSLWAFNQNMAQAGMGDRHEVVKRGEARIRAGRANVNYRPLAPTLAEAFAASRSADAAKRRELAGVYNENLKRFRDAQRRGGLGERDVASSLGLAFASYYEIYSGGRAASPAQERDIVRQFRESLLKNAYFQGTNDRYRQLLDENTAVQTVASLVLYRDAVKRGDSAAVEGLRREALAFLDFYWPGDEERARRIRLTPAGFRD
ncbi:MAG TPA: DUF6683 family protein [Pyrinomonadaceae bacterium]|nr:DUF6683 family protein [Pyrinomonadaceae bacterium]